MSNTRVTAPVNSGNGVTVKGCECYGAKGWHYPPCHIPALLSAAKEVVKRHRSDHCESHAALAAAVEEAEK